MNELSGVKEAIHGHEVLGVVASRNVPWKVDELRATIAARFGADAVFENCHGSRFSFEELLGFLASKGKLSVGAGEVSLGSVPGCQSS